MSGMHYLLGVKCNDFVILAADKTLFAHGALVVSQDHNKAFTLADHVMMVCIGEGGDVNQFGEFVAKNLALYKYKNGYEMSPKSAAHYVRRTIATNLRSQDAYLVDTILGGYDPIDKSTYLCQVDYLGSHVDSCDYLFRGFSGRFCLTIMDRLHRPDMSQAEAIEAVTKCLNEVKHRFVANLPSFKVYRINSDGIRELDDIAV